MLLQKVGRLGQPFFGHHSSKVFDLLHLVLHLFEFLQNFVLGGHCKHGGLVVPGVETGPHI